MTSTSPAAAPPGALAGAVGSVAPAAGAVGANDAGGAATTASAALVELSLVELYRAAVEAVEALPVDVSAYQELGEAALLEVNLLAATASKGLSGSKALIAGEIAHRSTPALGLQGLAQRAGHRTPAQFMVATNGVTGREAVIAVRVGALAREAATAGQVDRATGEVAVPSQPWLAPVAAALAARELSVEGAEAIRAGLGEPTTAVTADALRAAASRLCRDGASLPPDHLFRAAREARDELDVDGVKLREAERRAKRSLTFTTLPDGMSRLVWVMDPETAVTVKDVFDRLTSPKRGGVRFVADAEKTKAARILEDTRTVAQLASDGFEQLLRAGADSDSRRLLGSGAPVVRVTATRTAFASGHGLGRLDGQSDPVSISTVQRLTCTGATEEVTFDRAGRALDVGREQRTFTRRQREALAVRDGGCMMPDCQRPPSWCEAHHIRFWGRDHGPTNTADGILLCKHHHLLAHNNGWEIKRDQTDAYWLIPPPERDSRQIPIPLRSKSPALRDLAREAAAG
jgi:hypothetical protein